jgi:hypothetical protein
VIQELVSRPHTKRQLIEIAIYNKKLVIVKRVHSPAMCWSKHKCIMELLCNAANELIRCSKYVDDSSGNSKAVNKNTEQPNGSEISAPVNEDIVISGRDSTTKS